MSADPTLSVSTLRVLSSVTALQDLLALHPVLSAKRPVKISLADLMLSASPMALKPIASVKKAGHSILVILLPVVLTSMSVTRSMDRLESAVIMLSVRIHLEDTPASAQLDLLGTQRGCVSIWTSAANPMPVARELCVTT